MMWLMNAAAGGNNGGGGGHHLGNGGGGLRGGKKKGIVSSHASRPKLLARRRGSRDTLPPSPLSKSSKSSNGGGGGSSGGGNGGPSSRTTTLLIGFCMFCLVIVYVVVVVMVTRLHAQQGETTMHTILHNDNNIGDGGGDNSMLIPMNGRVYTNASDGFVQKSLRQILAGIQEHNQFNKNGGGAGGGRRAETPEERRKRNPFHKDRSNLNFGLGVQPDLILQQHNGDNGADNNKDDPNQAVAAVRGDPPVHEHPTPEYVLKAYLEPIAFDEWEVQPLPNRSMASEAYLKVVEYPRLQSCKRIQQQWPVDDTPAERDPFLPWIHDVFPTDDGKFVQFVAQNRRRCRTGKADGDILKFMAPAVANFQHISVKRIEIDVDGGSADGDVDESKKGETRYRLSNHSDADPDGIATRFICRFKPSMEETLSVYNFDYDWTSYRKRYKTTFEKNDGNIKSIHTSQLVFRCPVPAALQDTVRTGSSVRNDWASLFVDLIPIRTPPRFGIPHQYLQPKYKEYEEQDPTKKFHANAAYGNTHVLPRIRDSGRWENIPICKPSLMTYENTDENRDTIADAELTSSSTTEPKHKHHLVSCLWASAGYTTRGERFAINDGQRRLLEWITYNKMIGFDHFYVYDNSGAFAGGTTSLKPITDLFPGLVTHIPWPAQVCNNRPNNVDSPGERSSQYAAEASCRLRFGPHVHWIGQFDIDEYLVPMGKHDNILTLLEELDREDTRIVSFGSWRAWPRWAKIEPPVPVRDGDVCWHNEPCFHLRIPPDTTMLQAYNCDRQPPGQAKVEQMPAEKQLYRANYVLQHFVHYSAATVLSEMNAAELKAEGMPYRRRAFPDARQRFANELTEGLMLHSKSVAAQDTAGWERMCHINNTRVPVRKRGLCRLGVPWPKDFDKNSGKEPATTEGWAFNCYVNEKVEEYLVPKLEKALEEQKKHFGMPSMKQQQTIKPPGRPVSYVAPPGK